MTEELLRIDSLSLSIGSARILTDVSLHVDAGEIVGLVGESGSGKSSTIRAALRLLPSTATIEGSVRIRGREIVGADARTLRDVRANDVGFIQQDPRGALNPVRRIGDSVMERLVRVHGVSRREAVATARSLLEATGIPRVDERMRQYPHELSGGMLQRAVIASTLSTSPSLVFADEATSALDVTTQAEVLAMLRDQQRERGLGMLFITHDLRLASAICDRVYVLLHGEVVEELAGHDLFTNARAQYTRDLLAAMPGAAEGSRS